ncbi:nucleosome assembly protein family [Zymoseptoria tritici IPO323]|uniref:Nucleosome assembly protein family n=1 Tax=Zymoseptoria tritici (strain CBS 115943 / IPO323) TaxID=336722 RepID=F9XIQ8_ZYMTI|nr:nucleosome assembly protein family [Zymoseptoria tritici IPO323]EGP85113.1 nucleosome assembly protein family [Zymoseptoria tritici IPO323]
MAEESPISYEDLANIEEDFEEVDTEIVRQQYALSAPLYAKRSTTVSQIPNFWPLVLEQAPPELDSFISASDSQIFGESLLALNVTRPELENGAAGHPRSLKIDFTFKPNDFFEDTELSKTFSYRRAKDGWTGLVSEPVKIHWKKGKDLSEGLNDNAVALFEARKKAGNMLARDIPEYKKLQEKLESLNGANTSFFTFFGWRKAGERVEVPEVSEEDEEAADDSEVEVHEAGEQVAVTIAEDLWPNAIKFFTQAQELGEMSDVDFEEDDDEEESGEDEPVDIRALVGGKDKGKAAKRLSDSGPPSKKQKK